MHLPDDWNRGDSSNENDDALSSEWVIKHTPSTLTVQVVPSTIDEKFHLLLMMNSAGGGWLFKGGNKVKDGIDKALSFVDTFQSALDDEVELNTTDYLRGLGEALSQANLSLPSMFSVDRTPESDVETFFNGYIPFHFSDPMTEGAELCCPPGASLNDETHYRTTPSSEPLESNYHVVWEESFGKGLGWYCPDCNPHSLEDVDRLNIPGSNEWKKYMEKLESGASGEGSVPPIPESGHLTGGMIVRLYQAGVLKQESHSGESSGDAKWYYDQEEHRRIINTPEEWGQFVVGGDKDILLKCDIIGVNFSYNSGAEGRFAAVRNPRIVHREDRTYLWEEKNI